MSGKSLSALAEDYFYNLNPLTQRIGQDVRATKEAYEGLWNNLTLNEQRQAIDETIIQPEVCFKYARKSLDCNKESSESYPKLKYQTGLKYVIDDAGATLRWRDEHSAPFSFMTQSQMNLNLFDSLEDLKGKGTSEYIEELPNNYASPMKNNVGNRNDSFHSPSNQIYRYQNDFSNESDETSQNIFAKLINKTSMLNIKNMNGNDCLSSSKGEEKSSDADESTALLETPSSQCSSFPSSKSQEDEIPKTGFEFLDNW